MLRVIGLSRLIYLVSALLLILGVLGAQRVMRLCWLNGLHLTATRLLWWSVTALEVVSLCVLRLTIQIWFVGWFSWVFLCYEEIRPPSQQSRIGSYALLLVSGSSLVNGWSRLGNASGQRIIEQRAG